MMRHEQICLDNQDGSVAQTVADLSCIRVIEADKKKKKEKFATSKRERWLAPLVCSRSSRPIDRL